MIQFSSTDIIRDYLIIAINDIISGYNLLNIVGKLFSGWYNLPVLLDELYYQVNRVK